MNCPFGTGSVCLSVTTTIPARKNWHEYYRISGWEARGKWSGSDHHCWFLCSLSHWLVPESGANSKITRSAPARNHHRALCGTGFSLSGNAVKPMTVPWVNYSRHGVKNSGTAPSWRLSTVCWPWSRMLSGKRNSHPRSLFEVSSKKLWVQSSKNRI